MPLDQAAPRTVTGFENVPDFAKGFVRDIRVRWAMEEIGLSYATDLLDAFSEKPASYRAWQPFGQVPAFRDGEVSLFESGAILLYLGEQDERLLPSDIQGRWDATSWLIAALNSVEPPMMMLVHLDLFQAGKDWVPAARPATVELLAARLKSLSAALGDKDWLTGRFTVADIMMVTVLRSLTDKALLEPYRNLVEYQARGEARPAFRQALADQIGEFRETAQEPAQ